MASKRDIMRLGRDLHRHLYSKRVFDIVESQWGCGWTDGGCLVLAKALRRWLGAGRIMGLWETCRDGVEIQHHAVLVLGRWCLDGDGVTPLGGFADAYRLRENGLYGSLELRDYDFEEAHSSGVCDCCNMEDDVIASLDRKFKAGAILADLDGSCLTLVPNTDMVTA